MNETQIQERVDRAARIHESGGNCAQAVVCAYSDLLGVDEETLYKVSEGFGLGMGQMLTCGAVTAMYMVVGLLNSSGSAERGITKGATMKREKELSGIFLRKNGSITCREIKGVDTHQVLRSCPGCIEDAVRIIAEELFAE